MTDTTTPAHATPMGAAYAAHPAPPATTTGAAGSPYDYTAPPPSYFALRDRVTHVRGDWPDALGVGWFDMFGRLAAYRARVHSLATIVRTVRAEATPMSAPPMGDAREVGRLVDGLELNRRRSVYAYGTAAHRALSCALGDVDPEPGLTDAEAAATSGSAGPAAAALAAVLVPLAAWAGLREGQGPPPAVTAAMPALVAAITNPDPAAAPSFPPGALVLPARQAPRVPAAAELADRHGPAVTAADPAAYPAADTPAFADAVTGFADAVVWSLVGAVTAGMPAVSA